MGAERVCAVQVCQMMNPKFPSLAYRTGCSNGCALDIGVKDGKVVGVRGRATDRVNKGRLGPKGLNG